MLYRIPRGGPNTETWHKWFNFGGFGSFGGALIWAFWCAATFNDWVDPAHWWHGILITAATLVYLMLAEAPGYMKWVSPISGVKILPLTLRGLPLLNPFMGIIYHIAWKNKDRLPRFGKFIDGWTAWAELGCGAVVMTSLYLLAMMVK